MDTNNTGEIKIEWAIKPVFSRFSSYWVALRPWSFVISLLPVGLGSVLAYKVVGEFNILIFILTCTIALCVHAAGNLVNTYYDYIKGIDSKKSDDRTLVDHILSVDDVVSLGGLFYTIGCIGFLLLTWLSPTKMEHLALVYFGGLSGSFLYTGGLGLKYIALGDVLIFLTFGPVTVLFAFLSQGGPLSWIPLLYAIPLAINTEAILHTNNTRTMETDKEAGIVTLAILCGKTGSYAMFTLFLFTPYIIIILMILHCSSWFILPILTIFLAFRYERVFRQGHLETMPKLMGKINLQFGVLYIVAVAITLTDNLPGLSVDEPGTNLPLNS